MNVRTKTEFNNTMTTARIEIEEPHKSYILVFYIDIERDNDSLIIKFNDVKKIDIHDELGEVDLMLTKEIELEDKYRLEIEHLVNDAYFREIEDRAEAMDEHYNLETYRQKMDAWSYGRDFDEEAEAKNEEVRNG